MSTARLAGRPAGLYELTAGAGDRRCRRLASEGSRSFHHSGFKRFPTYAKNATLKYSLQPTPLLSLRFGSSVACGGCVK